MAAAWKRVKANKGSAGVDGLDGEQTGRVPQDRSGRRSGKSCSQARYRPSPVRRVRIPKPGGGDAGAGDTDGDGPADPAGPAASAATADRSRPSPNTATASGRADARTTRCWQAQRYVQAGYRVVVDVDLEKFFDRVNHDMLMDRLAKRIEDKRGAAADPPLPATRASWRMAWSASAYEGTPQGGPLSPLLANVLLDEVDRELERRGHRFVRYADDCNVYVRSQQGGRAGAGRAAAAATRELRLKVNEAKTAVAPVLWPQVPRLLPMAAARARSSGGGRRGVADLQAAHPAADTPDRRAQPGAVVQDLRRYVPGWKAYFRLAQTPRVLRELDEWLRHRLRALQLKHWRRGTTMYRELRALGASRGHGSAGRRQRPALVA